MRHNNMKNTNATTTALHPFNGLSSRTTWVSRYQKDKTSLDLNEARDDGVLGCSGISWTICKQSAPRSRQITTHGSDALLDNLTNSVKAMEVIKEYK